MKTYPHFNFFDLFFYNVVKGIKIVSLLNYVDFNKADAMKVLQRELEWIYYGGKHYESIYTRFYQGYVLPHKFGVDKRIGHLSDLINSGQITRDAALDELTRPDYDAQLLDSDLKYVRKKFGMTAEDWDSMMRTQVKSFREYKNSHNFVQFLRHTVNFLRSIGLYPR